MSINDKILLQIYPPYTSVYGPYERRDGRKHIVLNNSNATKNERGKTKTISYPKALIESTIGKRLLPHETADHVDDDFTNDNITNLQILSRVDNSKKFFIDNPDRSRKYTIFICPICKNVCSKPADQINHNRKQNKKGPFCSRSCAGKFNNFVQQVNKCI